MLGYRYDSKKDKILLSLNKCNSSECLSGSLKITKRAVLSHLARLFDPLGLVSPVVVRAKVFLRELWRSKFAWDELLPINCCKTWSKLCTDLNSVRDLEYDRQVVSSNSEFSMIVFCDSSKDAYGFAAYAVASGSSNLIFSKCKTAPLKAKSLPTLELLSVYLFFKCFELIVSPFCKFLNSVTVCIDAQIVLAWILTGKVRSKNIFAQNRVNDINYLLKEYRAKFDIPCTFKYVQTDLNPADLLTRGLSFSEFVRRRRFWLSGPEFLCEIPIAWPVRELNCLSRECRILTNFALVPSVANRLFDITEFSSLKKVHRVTAHMIRFMTIYLKKTLSRLECMRLAKLYWLRCEQLSHFSVEFDFLTNPKSNVRCPSLVNNLNLFIDEDGLIRCKGRLKKCLRISFDLNNPVLLPRFSYLSILYVWQFHFDCRHMGAATTLNALRSSGFWLTKPRALIKSTLKNCTCCKKLNSLPYRYPKRTDYLSDRVNFVRPFEHVGVDYTGHFFVKLGENVQKMYLLLYTCLNVRAVHLDLVQSMNTSDFLLSFVKFTSLYGLPSSIYSDNAPTFGQASNILNSSSLDNPLSEFLIHNSIKHVKIPLYAAWQGAAWERLIRTIKLCIFKSVGRKRLEFFTFSALLSDVQNVINSRPLTYKDSDGGEFDMVSPNSFLKFGQSCSLVFGNVDGQQLEFPSRKLLVSSLNKRDEILDSFTSEWFDSYLLSLREHDSSKYEDWIDRVAVGDVVLIYSPIKPRVHWNLGRIVELFTGSDGKVRNVLLKRSDGQEVTYSINLLYPLEIHARDTYTRTKSPTKVSTKRVQPSRSCKK